MNELPLNIGNLSKEEALKSPLRQYMNTITQSHLTSSSSRINKKILPPRLSDFTSLDTRQSSLVKKERYASSSLSKRNVKSKFRSVNNSP